MSVIFNGENTIVSITRIAYVSYSKEDRMFLYEFVYYVLTKSIFIFMFVSAYLFYEVVLKVA